MSQGKIDFVVTWVDGNDPVWQKEKAAFSPDRDDNSASENRFRDWELMPFWFRAVEKYAPWVNQIYFITCGHYPKWLNIEHPKLTLVNHRDYIPDEYLPTFNSNVIELFIHKIQGLEEQFVLFNDDMFLTAPAQPEDFFKAGMPCDCVQLDTTVSMFPEDIFPHIVLNNAGVINRHFSKKEVLRKYWALFCSPKYGKDVLRTILLWNFKYFSRFRDVHMPSSHLKSVFSEVWEAEPDCLRECAGHRFRSRGDVSHFLMKNWMACQGKVNPRWWNWGMLYEVGEDIESACRAIVEQKYKAVCLNDSAVDIDFEDTKTRLIAALTQILPEKSSYEK